MDLTSCPLKIRKNRVWRPYIGGKLLDQWQGTADPADGYTAEEWVASTVEARNTQPVPNEGLSVIEGTKGYLLRDAIASNPIEYLGIKHYKKFGINPGVLVKVLDSYNRLLIQVHPDKQFARDILNSNFGKTEAWYIIEGREICGEKPYVLLGFKPGVTREKWGKLFFQQEIEEMVNCLHKFYVNPGDAFLVEGGIPHAAGSGLFFLEIQEPTDYSMRMERLTSWGEPLPDFQMHQGAGFEKMLDCFSYDTYSRDEVLSRWYKKATLKNQQEGGEEWLVISPSDTSCFSMTRIDVKYVYKSREEDVFSVVVILSGEGVLIWEDGEMEVKQSDEVFLSANLGELIWKSTGENKLVIIRCYPPE